ncbi:hypothetical protein AZH53_10875 [Methanomicrobiaceae archaeon CYW5]|uniref:hypothetical protein n=1 Tax=Methanovulcanius yangii TaxID=1789227 RepID=UPI0029CA5EC0|nr:hypothetical protein [Methanovulcanius yangii]MBT8508907.1 hypothetical protein [Methanovulcanius yangii]
MESLDDEGQWIVLMGVVVATGMFILAIIINQAPMVGQSTAEAVLEFPKNEIQDIRYHLAPIAQLDANTTGLIDKENKMRADMQALSMARNNAVMDFDIDRNTGFEDLFYQYNRLDIHYNNGVTTYDEEYSVPVRL